MGNRGVHRRNARIVDNNLPSSLCRHLHHQTRHQRRELKPQEQREAAEQRCRSPSRMITHRHLFDNRVHVHHNLYEICNVVVTIPVRRQQLTITTAAAILNFQFLDLSSTFNKIWQVLWKRVVRTSPHKTVASRACALSRPDDVQVLLEMVNWCIASASAAAASGRETAMRLMDLAAYKYWNQKGSGLPP